MMKLHEFTMGDAPFASVFSCQLGSTKLESCRVACLPDVFRTESFGPLQDLELPLSRGTDEEFETFLEGLRHGD